jgi:hypothetical protein
MDEIAKAFSAGELGTNLEDVTKYIEEHGMA